METNSLPEPKQPLISFALRIAARVLGPLCLGIVRVSQVYANGRQLKKCNAIGARVACGINLMVDNAGEIVIGDDVSFCNQVLLSCYRGGLIKIGRHCFLGDNVKIAADKGSIEIGNDCLIAEDVSIRASNHGTQPGVLIRLQPNTIGSVLLGNDVWIGKGVTVLAGSVIADGCVIGANSVVRGRTEPNAVYAGVPIRKISDRAG